MQEVLPKSLHEAGVASGWYSLIVWRISTGRCILLFKVDSAKQNGGVGPSQR
jgi:hypothetical protein